MFPHEWLNRVASPFLLTVDEFQVGVVRGCKGLYSEYGMMLG
ncbi:hypothetical protein J500_2089 [Acinetobacter sp. 479375]|nr:hypothetical protein J500_2089 [Acinetobacter sp. 479375]